MSIRPARRLALFAAVVAASVTAARAEGPAGPLRYKFAAGDKVVYAVTLTTDLPDGTQALDGDVTYTVKSVDAANGQVTLDSGGAFRQSRTYKPGTMPRMTFGPGVGGPSQVVIDPSGTIVGTRGDSQLPYLLGPLPRLLLEPMPAGAKSDWQSQHPVQVQELLGNGVFPSPFTRQAHEDHAAQETDEYHVTGTADDGAVTVHKTVEMATAEKVGDQPLLKQSAAGDFVFDAQLGRVRKLDEKQTLTVRRDGVTIEVTTTVTAHLLGNDEAKQYLVDRAAADAKARAEFEKRRAEDKAAEQAASTTEKSPLVGGTGGGEFQHVGTGDAPLLGIWYTLGNWGGRGCVSEVQPIFAKDDPAPDHMDGAKSVVAKPGYVVAGLMVNRDRTNATGFRVVFARLKDGKVVVTDRYTSPTIGAAGTFPAKQIGLDGRTVVGLCGRKGINCDALGLVFAKGEEADPAKPVDRAKGDAPAEDPDPAKPVKR